MRLSALFALAHAGVLAGATMSCPDSGCATEIPEFPNPVHLSVHVSSHTGDRVIYATMYDSGNNWLGEMKEPVDGAEQDVDLTFRIGKYYKLGPGYRVIYREVDAAVAAHPGIAWWVGSHQISTEFRHDVTFTPVSGGHVWVQGDWPTTFPPGGMVRTSNTTHADANALRARPPCTRITTQQQPECTPRPPAMHHHHHTQHTLNKHTQHTTPNRSTSTCITTFLPATPTSWT